MSQSSICWGFFREWKGCISSGDNVILVPCSGSFSRSSQRSLPCGNISASSYCSYWDEVVGRFISVEVGINLLPSAVDWKADWKRWNSPIFRFFFSCNPVCYLCLWIWEMCHVTCLTNLPYNSVSLWALLPSIFLTCFLFWFLLLLAFAHGVPRDFYFALGIALYYGALVLIFPTLCVLCSFINSFKMQM